MKITEVTVTLVALACLSPAAAFVPSSTSGNAVRSSRANIQKSQTCAPGKPSAGFHGVRVSQSPSALAGTGPSYLDQVAEAEGEEEGDEEGEGSKKKKKKSKGPELKEKVKLEAEVTFYEGSPDISELAAPTVSILTVIGIVPFTAAVARQVWVKYTLTSRRIKIVSGFGGKDTTEVVYPDIVDMKYVWRFFGRCGDMVLTLRDGSKLEVRSLPEFERNYKYIFDRTSEACQRDSQPMKTPN